MFCDVGAPGPHIANIRVNYRRGMEELIAYLYAANPAITAVICANELMALGALRELRDICDHLFGPATPLQHEFSIVPDLVIRDSTGPAAPGCAVGAARWRNSRSKES